MKLLTALALCLTLLALCACGQVQPEEITTTPSTTTEITTTTEPPITPQPIKYPASYKDAPKAYKPVLDEFFYQAQPAYWGYGETCVIGGSYITEPWFTQTANLGYAIKDINNDGIPELLLLDLNNVGWGTYEGFFVYALFTLKDNKPVQLGQYWRRDYAGLTMDGTIYRVGSGGAKSALLTTYKLKQNAAELTKVKEHMGDLGIVCYEIKDENQQFITDEEFLELWEFYSSPPNPMQFTFIPIEQ